MNIVVVVQARTGSSRLPGKILMPLGGAPLLQRMLARLQRASQPDAIVIATTSEPRDDAVRSLCASLGVPCYSGDTNDLLDRHYRAGMLFDANAVVKIPSDCPLIDPRIVDRVLRFYREHAGEYDYVSNLHPPTYPDGNDVEIVSLAALRTAWGEAASPMEREHTTPYIWEHPERFRIGNIRWEGGLDFSMSHRWTIDYEEDYRFISEVFDALYPFYGVDFGLQEILALLEKRPSLRWINERYLGVNWYRNHLHELRTVHADMTAQPAGTMRIETVTHHDREKEPL
jgi:spore coat polysaccharide biosynthesis protein SpsF